MISVVIITHQKSKLLTNTLEAVLEQVRKDEEIVVLDSGGDDFDFVPKSPLIRYFQINPKPNAMARVKNTSILLAKGNYVITFDGECIPQKGCIEEYRENLKPGRLCLGRIEWQAEKDSPKRILDDRFDYDTRKVKLNINKTHGGNMGFYKPDGVKVGLFSGLSDSHWGYKDRFFGIKMSLAGIEQKYLFDALTIHQWHKRKWRDPEHNRALMEKKIRLLSESSSSGNQYIQC